MLTPTEEQSEFKPLPVSLLAKEKLVKPFSSRKSKEVTGSRWSIAIMLTVTILICFIFYFYSSASEIKDKLLSPISFTNELFGQPEATPTPSALVGSITIINQISDLTQNLHGRYGFYVVRLETNQNYGLHEDEVFPSASLIKLPVIASLYLEAESGNLNLNEIYTLKESDKVTGAGSLANEKAGKNITIRELVQLMGKQSDNTAFSIIRNKVGDTRISQTIKDWGLNNTSFVNFETTPKDVGLFFTTLYKGNKVNLTSRNEIFDLLTNTIFEDRIPAGIPKNIKVAHKVGTDVGVYADGGVVFAPKPFVLVIMTENALDNEAPVVIPQIVKIVWNFESQS